MEKKPVRVFRNLNGLMQEVQRQDAVANTDNAINSRVFYIKRPDPGSNRAKAWGKILIMNEPASDIERQMKVELQLAIAQLSPSVDGLYAIYAAKIINDKTDVENTLFYNVRGTDVTNPLMRHGLTFVLSYKAPSVLPNLSFEPRHYYHYE